MAIKDGKETKEDLTKGKGKRMGYHGFKHGNILLAKDTTSSSCTNGELIYHATRRSQPERS